MKKTHTHTLAIKYIKQKILGPFRCWHDYDADRNG